MLDNETSWTTCSGGSIPNIYPGLTTSGIKATFKIVWDKTILNSLTTFDFPLEISIW